MTEIIFTDRYGGRIPSGLTACYRCDAMGCYPKPPADAIDADGRIALDHHLDWEFVTCPACHGTAKVGWLTTARRVPGWLIKGIRFTFIEPRRFDPDMPRHKAWALGFKVAFLADLGLWNPNAE